jgi:hypothetical protein
MRWPRVASRASRLANPMPASALRLTGPGWPREALATAAAVRMAGAAGNTG